MKSLKKDYKTDRIIQVFFLGIIFLFTQSCSKEKPIVTTDPVYDITTTSATGSGKVIDDGNANVSVRGVCWSTNNSPTISDNYSLAAGAGIGSFTSSITGLTPGMKYYVKAYATNSEGTGYGKEVTFVTNSLLLATVTTLPVSSITSNSAESGGNIIDDGGADIMARGVCWNTLQNPSPSNFKTTDGTGTGNFTSSITGLQPDKIYYYRAYASNNVGTAYGEELNFSTLCAEPSATTNDATNIVDIAATFNGTVNANGSSTTVTFEFGTSTSYGNTTEAIQSPVTGIGNTSISAAGTGLTSHTVYHYRLKAVNCGGIIYGEDKTFTTSLCPSSISRTHTAGNVAPVTKSVIYDVTETDLSGTNKCWITSNLGATNQASSATDATEAAAGWYWQFNRKQGYKHDGTNRTPNTTWITSIDENSDWTAANDPCTIFLGSGWRIPTFTEWSAIITNGGWSTTNDVFTSILRIHPAGGLQRDNGTLLNRGFVGNYWSGTQNPSSNSSAVAVNIYQVIGTYGSEKSAGCTIRCLRD